MTRYIKQRNYFECGPVAIINALKWLGFNAQGCHVKHTRKECGTDKDGTTSEAMRKVIDTHIHRNTYVECPTLAMLDSALELGRAFILNYGYVRDDGEEEWHACLCIGKDGLAYLRIKCHGLS